MKVAIVGGTGTFGRALARKLRGAGHQVAVGSAQSSSASTEAPTRTSSAGSI
jgi:predicted dinucleotide-binding enzyme